MTAAGDTVAPVAVTKEGLAAAVKKARLAARLNQDELAERMGTSTTTISDIERGLRDVTVERLYEIAEATRRSAWEILADAGADEPSSRDRIASDQELSPRGRRVLRETYDLIREFEAKEGLTPLKQPPSDVLP